MPYAAQIETALARAFARLQEGAPPRLRSALEDAIFPAGGRLRPSLCLATYTALHGHPPETPQAELASSLELLHCASLVHDDLPCFDDAALRRGRLSVHSRHGEALAVLAGDGLILMAFESLASTLLSAEVALRLLKVLTVSAGPVRGLVAGQAWESETSVPLHHYHATKTGALFEASAHCGSILASEKSGRPSHARDQRWAQFGALLGQAYQIADDLHDVRTGSPHTEHASHAINGGKPVGKDASLSRPNAALAFGEEGARQQLRTRLDQCMEALPVCADPKPIHAWLDAFSVRLVTAVSTASSWQETPQSASSSSSPSGVTR